MTEKVNWVVIFQVITGIVVLAVLLAIAWLCLAESQAVADSQQETPRQRSADMPPSYDEAIRIQPSLRYRNSVDTTSHGVRNNGRDTVQSNSEQASCSQNQSGESQVINSNDNKSQTERGSNVKSISEDEHMCVVNVDRSESTEENNSKTIVTYYKLSDSKLDAVKGGKCKQGGAGKEPNAGKSSCETSDCKDSGSNINYGAGSSRTQGFTENDITVFKNAEKFNKKNEGGDKNEESSNMFDTEHNYKIKCDKEYDTSRENNSGEDRHKKCEDDVSSIANSEGESIGQYCSADDVSISSKYDTASGGSGVTME